jgi:hypothetical protein
VKSREKALFLLFSKKKREKVWWKQKNDVPLQPQIRNQTSDEHHEHS